MSTNESARQLRHKSSPTADVTYPSPVPTEYSLIAVLAGLACTTLIFSLTSHRQHGLGLAGCTTIFFGWFAPAGVPIILLLLVLTSMSRSPKSANTSSPWRLRSTIGLLTLTCIIAAIWSPNPNAALYAAVVWVALLVMVGRCWNLVPNHQHLRILSYYLMVPMLVLAMSIMAFRISPELERTYYQSSLSRLFLGNVGANIYSGFDRTTNNALEVDRAAGILFVNVNRASMALGVAFLVIYAVSKFADSNLLKAGSIVIAAAIPFTGSKTGTLLLVSALAVLTAARFAGVHKDAAGRAIGTILPLGAVALGARAVLQSADQFITESQQTLRPRRLLWREAWRALEEAPLSGLGFGGWENRWATGGVQVPFIDSPRPVHNWLLQAWLDAGIGYAALNALLAALVLATTIRCYRSTTRRRSAHRLPAALALAWVVFHGFGDNTPLYGDASLVAIMALAWSLALHTDNGPAEQNPNSRLDSFESRTSAPGRRL